MNDGETDVMAMMKGDKKGCRRCALIPVTFGTFLFLPGCFQDAEAVRILSPVFTGIMVFMGIFMFVMAGTLFGQVASSRRYFYCAEYLFLAEMRLACSETKNTGVLKTGDYIRRA